MDHSECPILGPAKDFADSLPTIGDVLSCYYFELLKKKKETAKNASVSSLCDILVPKLESLWTKLEPNTKLISNQEIKRHLVKLHSEYLQLRKVLRSSRKRSEAFEKSLKEFKEKTALVFDISVCHCRKARCTCKSQKRFQVSHTVVTSANDQDDDTARGGAGDQDSEDFQATDEAVPRLEFRLHHFSLLCDRYEISDRAAAALASGLLLDLGHITVGDPTNIIDRNKVRRERKAARKAMQEKNKVTEVESLFFDGRKDKTKVFSKTDTGRWRRQTVTEEHICLIAEPGSAFIGHTAPKSGKSASVCGSITNHLESKEVSTENLRSVGCDGTNVNTGHLGCIIKLLEDYLGRPLQWLVCLLHNVELLMRHMMEEVDGPTNGPRAFKGPIGKDLQSCTTLEVAEFTPIPTDLKGELDPSDLSTDQQYMWRIVQAVASGNCPQDLANLNIGPLSHARFLTLACRILRLYVGTVSPSENLVTLATFVMQVYAPQWFDIKHRSSCTQGSKHIFKAIERCRYLEPRLLSAMKTVIQHNGYFAHSENVLLAMLCDEKPDVRTEAALKILSARRRNHFAGRRHFKVPTINFNAQNYTAMVSLEGATEPPLTKNLTEEEIWDIAKGITTPRFAAIPCHTQAVERGVKLVTEASAKVCGGDSRDGFIKARLESRRLLKKFETKSDFFSLLWFIDVKLFLKFVTD